VIRCAYCGTYPGESFVSSCPSCGAPLKWGRSMEEIKESFDLYARCVLTPLFQSLIHPSYQGATP
jgi:hypothetical protein